VALQALALIPDADVVVSAPDPVCRYAEDLGFRTAAFEMKRSHRLTHAGRVLLGALRVRRLARAHDAEVLYANGTRAIPYAVCARALGGPPVLFHHHGLLTGGPVRTLVRWVDRWTDALVVPTQVNAEPFRQSSKVHIVANGVDLARFSPSPDPGRAKRELGIPEDARVVGTVTRPDPTKGMLAFLDLAERLRDSGAWFLLAGGPTFPHEVAAYGRVREKADALGSRVILTGSLDDPRRAYWAMDCFVHLGEPEVQPLTILEAMGCGLPIVGYHWSGLPELLGEDGLLVEPGRVDAAAGAVQRLLADSERSDALSASGRHRCESLHRIEQTADALRRVLTETVSVDR
jgi:glycosyltransferase involved in cell wall biosynthesis